MFGIFAKSFMTATRADTMMDRRECRWTPPSQSWIDEDLPFRHHAGTRRGYHD